MKLIILATFTLASIASANTADVLQCTNNNLDLIVGLNAIPDNIDSVSVLVENKINGDSEVYVTDIPNNTLGQEFANGLRLNAHNGAKNVALLTVENKTATFVSAAGLQRLTCVDIE